MPCTGPGQPCNARFPNPARKLARKGRTRLPWAADVATHAMLAHHRAFSVSSRAAYCRKTGNHLLNKSNYSRPIKMPIRAVLDQRVRLGLVDTAKCGVASAHPRRTARRRQAEATSERPLRDSLRTADLPMTSAARSPGDEARLAILFSACPYRFFLRLPAPVSHLPALSRASASDRSAPPWRNSPVQGSERPIFGPCRLAVHLLLGDEKRHKPR
jgi:hypothetical protein